VGATDLYRYVDDNGTTVLNPFVPPKHIEQKGYEVLNDQGRVTQVIRSAELDAFLPSIAPLLSTDSLRLYSTPDDRTRTAAQVGRDRWVWLGAR
jgi:hypothetical protein